MRQFLEQESIPYLISKCVVGSITPEEKRLLDDWRRQSATNEQTFQRLMDVHGLSGEVGRRHLFDYHRPLADMKRRLGLDEEAEKVNIRGVFRARIYKYVAAVAVVLLVVGSTIYLSRNAFLEHRKRETAQAAPTIMPGHTQATLTLDNGTRITLGTDARQNAAMLAKAASGGGSKMNDLTTPRGGEFKVTLEDGTEVWLNADSKLRYPESFDGDERRVELSGEAYFKVAHNADKPFYVVSGKQEVRVYGTEFNVHAYQDEPEIYTTLVEGRVSLRSQVGSCGELVLTPGHQAVFNRAEASARVHVVDTDVVTSWRSGAFVFEDQTMAQIMKTLSRWYDFEYEFADSQVAQTVFMGSIPKYGEFKNVADIFRKMGGIHLTLKNNKVIISSN